LLRSAIAAAQHRVIASYARMDLLSGRARVPSLYFFELASASTGGALDVRRLEEDARASVETQAGWPAPHDPLQAIDDGEFDLATLGPALDRPETAPGLGAYLTRLQSPLAEALRARWAKWDKSEWHRWDGYQTIGGESLLGSFALDRHVYSASLLEAFAACPYKFFLSAIQRLRPPDRHGTIHKMPADVRGRIFHAAAFRYVRALLHDGLEDLDAKLRAADAALSAVASEYEELLAPALQTVWNRGVESIRTDLRSWIVEHEWSSPNWRPIAAELSFGTNGTHECDPASTPDPLNILGMLLRGSIDLIEGTDSGTLRVIDHKTGKPQRYRTNLQGDPTYYRLRAVGGGEVLQPLLYGLAAEALTGRSVTEAQLSYSTLRGGFETEPVQITQSTRKAAMQVLTTIDGMLRRGALPAAPRPGACRFCEYNPICGPYEEERAERKPYVPALNAVRILD
jgi:ATP-dependent helicase/nuclease subunit B